MEAIWKATRIIGLTCCLGLIATASVDRVDGTVIPRGETPVLQEAQSLTDFAAVLKGQEVQSLTDIATALPGKEEVAKRHRAAFSEPEGVYLIGKAQEKARVFRTERR